MAQKFETELWSALRELVNNTISKVIVTFTDSEGSAKVEVTDDEREKEAFKVNTIRDGAIIDTFSTRFGLHILDYFEQQYGNIRDLRVGVE